MIDFLKSIFNSLFRFKSSPQTLGARGEEVAAQFLKRQGYRILYRSYKTKSGEVDIIAQFQQTLIFCEVKTRSSLNRGHPLEAIDTNKQRQITKVALEFLRKRRLKNVSLRFDAIGIIMQETGEILEIKHVPAAFDASQDLG